MNQMASLNDMQRKILARGPRFGQVLHPQGRLFMAPKGVCQFESPNCLQEDLSIARAGRPNPQKAAKFDLCVLL